MGDIKYHCRHCGMGRVKIYKAFKYKTYEKVYPKVRDYVLAHERGDDICVENTAINTRCTFGLVRKAFMQLNREGVLSQATKRAPHDSTRDPWCGPGGDSAWVASYYTVLKK